MTRASESCQGPEQRPKESRILYSELVLTYMLKIFFIFVCHACAFANVLACAFMCGSQNVLHIFSFLSLSFSSLAPPRDSVFLYSDVYPRTHCRQDFALYLRVALNSLCGPESLQFAVIFLLQPPRSWDSSLSHHSWLMRTLRAGRHGSVVKSICCSSRGPKCVTRMRVRMRTHF